MALLYKGNVEIDVIIEIIKVISKWMNLNESAHPEGMAWKFSKRYVQENKQETTCDFLKVKNLSQHPFLHQN